MRSHISPSSITLLPSVIERIPVLLFAGDQDYICNYMGIEKMIGSMTWDGETGLGVSFSSISIPSVPFCTSLVRLLTFLVCRRHKLSHGVWVVNQPGHGLPHETSPMSRYGVRVYDAASMLTFCACRFSMHPTWSHTTSRTPPMI